MSMQELTFDLFKSANLFQVKTLPIESIACILDSLCVEFMLLEMYCIFTLLLLSKKKNKKSIYTFVYFYFGKMLLHYIPTS